MTAIWRRLKRWWMAFARALGWVNTRVILTIVYLVVIGIPAIVLRVIRRDLLDRKCDAARPSYWVKKDALAHTVEEIRRQF